MRRRFLAFGRQQSCADRFVGNSKKVQLCAHSDCRGSAQGAPGHVAPASAKSGRVERWLAGAKNVRHILGVPPTIGTDRTCLRDDEQNSRKAVALETRSENPGKLLKRREQ